MLYRAPAARRRGTVAILVAVSLTVLLGVLAIGLDGGVLQDDRRRAQGAADAAALAAATELYKSYPAIAASSFLTLDPNGTAAAAALTSTAANGFTKDVGGASVTVNIAPRTGPFTGKAGYAEVVIS